MGTVKEKLETWPRNMKGEAILKTSEQAIFYAVLIYTNKPYISEIRKIRKKAIQEVRDLKKKPNLNYDRLMQLACKAQFARECLEEVERLQDQDIQNHVTETKRAARGKAKGSEEGS